MSIDTADISLSLMSTCAGKPTMFINVFWNFFHLRESTLFHHNRIVCYEQQKHEPMGLLGPGCASTYVDVYKSHMYITYTVGNKILCDIVANNDVWL